MTKSYVRELTRLYRAMLKDVAAAYPEMVEEIELDQTRLLRLVESRGIHVFVVDLPAIGKHLDRCLANGAYKLSGLPLTKRYSNRVVIPKLFRGLYLRVFDESGSLKEDCDVQAICLLRQLCYAAKKAKLHCGADKVAAEVAAFVAVDSELPEPERFWMEEGPCDQDIRRTYRGFAASPRYQDRASSVVAREGCGAGRSAQRLSTLLGNLDMISGLLSSTLGSYDPSQWNFKHGPGVVSDRRKFTNKYNPVNWSDRLDAVFPCSEYAYYGYTAWIDHISRHELGSEEPASKLIDVPKTYSKPRLIAAEPSEHMWCQQSVKHFMYSMTERTWIGKFVRFTDQSQNQRLCVEGSTGGHLATVDLSAASDRVSCQAVGNLFRANPALLKALQASRTRYMEQDLNQDLPSRIELNKYSTMGNATTFPVESLLFLGITLAAVITKRQLAPTLHNLLALQGEVTVFGDDIIVPEDSRELLFEALEVLDFQVNADKSFWTGRFRESCGVDSFGGEVVTPAYWKAPNDGSPDAYSMTVDVANNFYSRFLVNASAVVMSTIGREVPLVPYNSGFCGRKSFVDPPLPPEKRWNEDLQRTEYRVPVSICKQERQPITDTSALLQYFTEAPPPHIMWEGGVAQRPESKLRLRWVPEVDLVKAD